MKKIIGKVMHRIQAMFRRFLPVAMSFYAFEVIRRRLERRERMPPPFFMPRNLKNDYLLNGKVKMFHWYFSDDYSSLKPRVYKKQQINRFIEQVKQKKKNYYGQTDIWLYQALEKYSVLDKKVLIIGSRVPWYESICIANGGHPTTIEYNELISEDARLKTITPKEFDERPVQCDAAFSISSFEHDGLGRYGDPLNPKGDLEAMRKMRSILKPDGIMFLAVPVGEDAIFWNAHRVYGKVRLPMLLENWKTIDSFGFSEELFSKEYCQPIFVLKNTGPLSLDNYMRKEEAQTL